MFLVEEEIAYVQMQDTVYFFPAHSYMHVYIWWKVVLVAQILSLVLNILCHLIPSLSISQAVCFQELYVTSVQIGAPRSAGFASRISASEPFS